jgi:enamine deaminase RidA (YjgF/YER057c/UK114 family)
MSTPEYFHSGSRMSKMVIHNGTIYLSGQVGTAGASVTQQTQDVLAKIDDLLAEGNSDKSNILSATIWMASMDDFQAMNSVWDAWVDQSTPPARATGESKLATPDFLVEIMIVAAVKS